MRELRVHGPPGTGKTTHLKGRVEATARERGKSSIRIASLTRAAAAEIGERVELPKEQVGTLHAHAFRALEHPELAETREGLSVWNDRARNIAAELVMPDRMRDITLDDAGGDGLVAKSEGEGLLQQYQTLRARCLPRELWPERVRSFAEHWETFKRVSKRLDFTDLIEQAAAEFPMMPGAPAVFLLDEAQDMSRLEMQLARQWGNACEVFVVVGDPYQNLYQWRGSEPEAFDDVELDPSRIRVLEQSWRVPHAVHAHAVAWLNRTLPGGLRIEYKPRDADGRVRRSNETYRSPEGLAQQLERELDDGRRVMVLGATGYMLDPLIAILRRRGVPFGNPYKVQHGGWNPLYGAQRLLALLRPNRDTWQAHSRWWWWSDVNKWAEPLDAKAVFERGAKTFIEGKCTALDMLRLDKTAGDEPAEFEALVQLIKPEHRDLLFDVDHRPDATLDWYSRHIRKSRASSLAYGLNVAQKGGGRALLRAPRAAAHGTEGWPGIVLGTIHSVKGGEADTVYVFPDVSNAGHDGWIGPGWRHDAIARQFYVAFTRARDELVLCAPSTSLNVPFDE